MGVASYGLDGPAKPSDEELSPYYSLSSVMPVTALS